MMNVISQSKLRLFSPLPIHRFIYLGERNSYRKHTHVQCHTTIRGDILILNLIEDLFLKDITGGVKAGKSLAINSFHPLSMAILHKVFSRRTFAFATGGTALVLGGGYWYLNSGPAYPVSTKTTRRPPPPWTPPLRSEMLKALKASGRIKTLNSQTQNTSREEEFDLLIVGGGATGAGCAVDAASRGLKVALVERDDFAAGKIVLPCTPFNIV
jgi:hypothetical protein